MDILSQKIRLFVEAYAGDEVEAMQLAGYTGEPAYLKRRADELLKNPNVIQALRERQAYLNKTKQAIADREERQMFFSQVMRNQDPHAIVEYDDLKIPKKRENIPMSQRIKAAELLGKTEGDFVDHLKIEGTITVTEVISGAYQIPDSEIDVIEAEYTKGRKKKEQESSTVPAIPTAEDEPKRAEPDKSSGLDDFI